MHGSGTESGEARELNMSHRFPVNVRPGEDGNDVRYEDDPLNRTGTEFGKTPLSPIKEVPSNVESPSGMSPNASSPNKGGNKSVTAGMLTTPSNASNGGAGGDGFVPIDLSGKINLQATAEEAAQAAMSPEQAEMDARYDAYEPNLENTFLTQDQGFVGNSMSSATMDSQSMTLPTVKSSPPKKKLSKREREAQKPLYPTEVLLEKPDPKRFKYGTEEYSAEAKRIWQADQDKFNLRNSTRRYVRIDAFKEAHLTTPLPMKTMLFNEKEI